MMTPTRRSGRLALTFALAVAVSLVPTGAAGARTAVRDAAIRAAHFSPTTPGVDVYLSRFSGAANGATRLWLTKVHYGAVTGYQALTPGVYTVSMRPAGAPASSKPVLTWTLDAKPGAAYTVAGVGAGSAVRGVVVSDDLSSPPPGEGRVRVIQAASRAPVARVSATGGHVISPDVHFATVSSYQTLPAGTWRVSAVSTSSSGTSASAPVTVRDGQVTSILLLDAKTQGITLRTVLDSASSGVMPGGAVPAGGGGAATSFVTPSDGDGTLIVALAALVALVAVGTAGRRVAVRSRPTGADARPSN